MIDKSPKQRIGWKKVAIATGIGILALMIATAVYDRWRISQGWCTRFSPGGTQKVLYGDDCWK